MQATDAYSNHRITTLHYRIIESQHFTIQSFKYKLSFTKTFIMQFVIQKTQILAYTKRKSILKNGKQWQRTVHGTHQQHNSSIYTEVLTI